MKSKIYKKLKQIYRNLVISFMFGFKRTNDEMFAQTSSSTTNKITDEQKEESQSLAEALLNAQVTEQVEELVWRTHTVDKGAKDNYKYLGNGVAKKIEKTKGVSKIIQQENFLMTQTVLETLKNMELKNNHIINIFYSLPPKINIEKFIKCVIINQENKTITLKFSNYVEANDLVSKTFHSQLKAIKNIKSDYVISKHDLLSSIENIKFYTYNGIGIDDNQLINVDFISTNIETLNYKEKDGFIYLTFNYLNLSITDNSPHFKSKSMEKKYKNKEKKIINLDVTIKEEKRCEICDAIVNDYDAKITKYDYGKILCLKCLKKEITK